MKFLNEEAAASRTIDRDLANLDRRWNALAKNILSRIELVSQVWCKNKNVYAIFNLW